MSQETPELPTQLSSSPVRSKSQLPCVSSATAPRVSRKPRLRSCPGNMAKPSWNNGPQPCQEDSASTHSRIPQTNTWDCSCCSHLPGEVPAHTLSSRESSAGISLAPPCSKHCPGPAEEVSPPLSIFPGPRPQPRRGADGRRHKGKAITDSPSGQSTSARQHTELVPLLPAPCPAPQPSQSPRCQGSARPSLAALPCPELAGTEAT